MRSESESQEAFWRDPLRRMYFFFDDAKKLPDVFQKIGFPQICKL